MSSYVYVIQRDSLQDMAYQSTPILGVCTTERQALRYIVADIVSEHLDPYVMSRWLPSKRQPNTRTEKQREWDSFRYVSRYWVSRWPVDDSGERYYDDISKRVRGVDSDNMNNIFRDLAALEFSGGRQDRGELIVDIDKRIKDICARCDTDEQVTAFFTGLLKEASKVEAFLDTLSREKHTSGRDICS